MGDKTILVVDDNDAVITALELLLELEGWSVVIANSVKAALTELSNHEVDLVVQDMNFKADKTSGEEGIELFYNIRDLYPDLPIILLTAWTHLETAVELVRGGAADYLAKPWDDKKLLTTVRNLLELGGTHKQLKKIKEQHQRSRSALFSQYQLNNIVCHDPATENVIHLACQVAKSDIPVLISGPNGSGKERIAELIHANSTNPESSFVAVNCGALPKDLIEAELFGAQAGAYTGANKLRVGRFEAADGGTLFLDEIGNLPLEGQVKLLRVLETQQFERLGSTKTIKVNVRVVSATNADLSAMVAAGEFREDLYYRLNVIELNLPALIDRPQDILPLAYFFLSEEKTISSDAQKYLLEYAWPGNVRELRNTIKRAELLCKNETIRIEDLALKITSPQSTKNNVDLNEEKKIKVASDSQIEVQENSVVKNSYTPKYEPSKEDIESALKANHGVVANAAEQLGLSRQSLYRRMDRFGLRKK
ncbi:sigma-54 dependent transcriptional regulator [Sessilibacter sp. MAH1]